MQLGHVTEAEAAFKKALELKDPHNAGVHAIRVLAQMKQGLGNHWEAIRVLNKAIELHDNPERIQCFFLRGVNYAASCLSSLMQLSAYNSKVLNAVVAGLEHCCFMTCSCWVTFTLHTAAMVKDKDHL